MFYEKFILIFIILRFNLQTVSAGNNNNVLLRHTNHEGYEQTVSHKSENQNALLNYSRVLLTYKKKRFSQKFQGKFYYFSFILKTINEIGVVSFRYTVPYQDGSFGGR